MKDFRDKIKKYILNPEQGDISPVRAVRQSGVKNPHALMSNDNELTELIPGKGIPAFLIVDFGKEITGYIRIEFVVAQKVRVEVDFGESLDECMNAPTEHQNTLPVLLGEDTCELKKVVSAGGLECVVWAPMVWRTFRYLRVKSHGELKVRSVSARLFTYPADYYGYFLSSDELLNRIWASCAYTVLLCMRPYYYIDGPKRDNALWIGDIHIEALVNYYAFGCSELTKNTLMLISQQQRPDGSIPSSDFRGFEPTLSDWCAFWIIALRDYYQYSGDKKFILSCRHILIRQVEWFISRTNKYGLIAKRESEFDWAYSLNRPGEVAFVQMCYYMALTDASWLLKITGDTEKSRLYLKIAVRLKSAINKVFWSEKKGAYVDFRRGNAVSRRVSEDSNAFAVLSGVAGRSKAVRILKYLKRKMWSPYGSLTLDRAYQSGGKNSPQLLGDRHNRKIWPFANFYEAEAHFHHGNGDDAIELIRRCWGNMLNKDATTFWEWVEEDGSIPEIFTSLCHGFSAGAAYSLQANILGIKPTKAGFTEFSITPYLGSLSFAEGAVPTPKGQITASFKKDNGQLSCKFKIPSRTTADIAIPKKKSAGNKVLIDDTLVYSDGRSVKRLPFVEKSYQDSKYIHFQICADKIPVRKKELMFIRP